MRTCSSGQNVVVTLSAINGVSLVLSVLSPYVAAVDGTGSTYLDPQHLRFATKYMNKLALEPPFAQGMSEIFSYLNETAPASTSALFVCSDASRTDPRSPELTLPSGPGNRIYAVCGADRILSFPAVWRRDSRRGD